MSLYPGHIPISCWQNAFLAVGSSVASIYNPYRHDMVAVCGEATGKRALQYMQKKMLADKVGREILEKRPRINTSCIDFECLRNLPSDTFGNKYASMMDQYKITPDSRQTVRFVDDPDLAYVMQRYREVHDFNHLLLGQPTNMLGEVVVKWFEALQTGLPMCYMAALVGPVRLSLKRKRILRKKLPWVSMTARNSKFFMNMYFENIFHESLDDVRKDMGIVLPK